ncbi:MAG: hypothetical protein EBZ59_06920 [Planctomycetia bacterium]|nr:hypothetical protein [Planctomycetia bacterium]
MHSKPKATTRATTSSRSWPACRSLNAVTNSMASLLLGRACRGRFRSAAEVMRRDWSKQAVAVGEPKPHNFQARRDRRLNREVRGGVSWKAEAGGRSMARGDRLRVERLLPGARLPYAHHGIDVGDGTVVHARPDDPRPGSTNSPPGGGCR